MRDHEPLVIKSFNGLWSRGSAEAVPNDHFVDCQNIKFSQSSFLTRDGIDIFFSGIYNILRGYMYTYQDQESLLLLDQNGNIYHTGSPTPTTPILTIIGMLDFAFVNISGRAYISPNDGNIGLQNQVIYVYKGDGTPARKAGGTPPSGTLGLANSGSGNVEPGVHVIGVAFETDTGYITQMAGLAKITATGTNKIAVTSIPVSSDSFIVARRLVATIAIDPNQFTGDLQGYQFFFVPDGRIADNTTTSLNINFFDQDLLDDATYLLNLFTNIPAGANLSTYHGRLISVAEFGVANTTAFNDTFGNISLARVSAAGQPEAVDQVTGLIIAPLDGKPLTNAQEYRDVLYLFKQTRTFAYNDNGQDPSSWPLTIIDQGVGSSIHGIATVLDSGGINVDALIIADYSGIILFNGSYIRPELSWKIKDFWFALDRTFFKNIQILNDSLSQVLYLTLPNKQMLIGDYSNGMDPQDIRWAKWTFAAETTTIALIDTNKLIIGSNGEV